MSKQTPLTDTQLNMLEIYDALMFEFEPDLVSAMIPELDYIHQGESKQERKERLQRYAEAFEMFFAAFEDMAKGWESNSLNIKQEIVKEFAQEVGLKEEDLLTSIEKEIDDSTDK